MTIIFNSETTVNDMDLMDNLTIITNNQNNNIETQPSELDPEPANNKQYIHPSQ